MTQFNVKNKPSKKGENQPVGQPDPETLGKTDPQEHMEGPISSLVHKVEKTVDKNDQKAKK